MQRTGFGCVVDSDLVYIPFALDAVATATGPATATPGAVATEIRHADLFSLADLQTMYRTCSPVHGGTTSWMMEEDGTVFATDPKALGPFSIGQ
jgi:hypothetical protein